jgi:hypothetical protein
MRPRRSGGNMFQIDAGRSLIAGSKLPPGRIALRTRFSAIRPASSIYERYHEWDIERFFN